MIVNERNTFIPPRKFQTSRVEHIQERETFPKQGSWEILYIVRQERCTSNSRFYTRDRDWKYAFYHICTKFNRAGKRVLSDELWRARWIRVVDQSPCSRVRHSSGFVMPKGTALRIKCAAQWTGYAEVTNAVRRQDRGVLEATLSTCLDSSVAIWKGKYYVCACM